MKTLKVLVLSALVGFAGFAASAVDTNIVSTAANVAPYFSTASISQAGGGIVLTSEPIGPATTNSYYSTYGTNASGSVMNAFSFGKAQYVAFGSVATGTNASSSGSITVVFDAGTGAGDWVAIATNTCAVSGVGTASGSITVNVGGYAFGRVRRVGSTDATYTTTVTSGFSSKQGL